MTTQTTRKGIAERLREGVNPTVYEYEYQRKGAGKDAADTIDALVEALEPFAAITNIINEKVPDHYGLWSGGSPNTGQTTITVGHARAARTAIAKARGEADTTEGR